MKWTLGFFLSLFVALIAAQVYSQAQIATGLGVGWPTLFEWLLIFSFPSIIFVSFYLLHKKQVDEEAYYKAVDADLRRRLHALSKKK